MFRDKFKSSANSARDRFEELDYGLVFIDGLLGVIIFIVVMLAIVSHNEWKKEGYLAYGKTVDGAEYRAWVNGRLRLIQPDGTREIIFFSVTDGSVIEYRVYKGETSITYRKTSVDKSLDWQGKVLTSQQGLVMASHKYDWLIKELLAKLYPS